MIWKAVFRGRGREEPGPFSWIHGVFLVRKKRITLGYVNWSLFWFINSVYPFPNLSTRETIYVDWKQALRLVDIVKNRATCGSRGSLRSPLEMRACPQTTIRQSGKYHSILGGASCTRDVCLLLCSLRELKMQRIRCNFKRSWCIARSNRAKSKGYCLLEFKENYGIFRIGQFRSPFDR